MNRRAFLLAIAMPLIASADDKKPKKDDKEPPPKKPRPEDRKAQR